ncbi:TetR/AcrR family transcriptional regulator [Brevundimonas sp.]|uniref:TetR/AcrR family transcriptional regulator n=1 Tax=Brevundimonas sp. TaxID=1871086 RepID=UPI003D1350F5
MTTAQAARPPVKRSKGRPAGDNDVGGDRILAAAESLLKTLPPARVTIARIAQEAGVDPALIRYYFGDRTRLLMAVAGRVTANKPHAGARTLEPQAALIEHIRKTIALVRSAPFMHRLMVEELNAGGTDETRARTRDMNADLVEFYRELLEADGGETLRAVDPLFLHVIILGASDFFVSADPVITPLLPPGTDRDELMARFNTFLVDVLLNGLKPR